MAAVSISLAMRLGILLILLASVYFTMNSVADSSQKQRYAVQFKEISELVSAKVNYGLKSAELYNTNTSQKLLLPQLGTDYTTDLSCDDDFNINVSGSVVGRSYLFFVYLNCSRINASGIVSPGEKCLITEKINSTHTNISLVDNCGNL